ncbi:MAG: SulP family inorganic anion transporter [Halopseudomonas sp.]|uniref:SulP family inorganic anion transporter n=1 Tax=Halopseudomonas sp. TaxID=2901191 RepID=UPI003002AD96
MPLHYRCLALLRRLLPFLQRRPPHMAVLRSDVIAGLTVGLVLIPQALAYAQLAGMPAVTGLYAALLPGVVGALFGSSALLAVDPVALSSLLTFAALQPLAVPASNEWVTLAIWLAIYSGLFQFLLGAFRLGVLANLVSNAVIKGFVTAAAIIIALSQLPALLGQTHLWGLGWSSLPLQGWLDLEAALSAAAVGLGAVAALLACKHYLPRLPGIMLVCLGALMLSQYLGFAERGGAVVGEIVGGLPQPSLPATLSLETHLRLLLPALVIALLSFTEAMASCRTVARATHEPWSTNQELLGQGLAKIASGLCGSFPVSGSFSRTALNVYSGARTRCATLVASTVVLCCLIGFTGILYHLPKAVLAAIIIVPVWRLIDLKGIRRLLHDNPRDGLVALATLITTLLSGPHLYWGVIVGLALSLSLFLARHVAPRIVEVSLHESGALRDRHLYDLPPIAGHVLAVRMDASLTYLTAPVLEAYIRRRLGADHAITSVLVCASALNQIDSTGLDTLRDLHQLLAAQGIALYLSSAKRPVREALHRSGLLAELGERRLFATDLQALEHLACPEPHLAAI